LCLCVCVFLCALNRVGPSLSLTQKKNASTHVHPPLSPSCDPPNAHLGWNTKNEPKKFIRYPSEKKKTAQWRWMNKVLGRQNKSGDVMATCAKRGYAEWRRDLQMDAHPWRKGGGGWLNPCLLPPLMDMYWHLCMIWMVVFWESTFSSTPFVSLDQSIAPLVCSWLCRVDFGNMILSSSIFSLL
jgi:hypothetical protein